MPKTITEQQFSFYCATYGFDLTGFDAWLDALEPCGAREELIGRRARAKQGAAENNTEAAHRHLEWMLLRWKFIRTTEALQPLALQAKRHSKVQSTRRKDRPAVDPTHDPGRNDRIRAFLARGNSAKDAATEFDLSVEQIRRIKGNIA